MNRQSISHSRRHALSAFAAAAMALGAGHSQASASEYPAKPVKIIVPFAAGGSGDLVTRLVAQGLTERLGQSFIVENRTGAAGGVGAGAVVRADPDGYTLGFVSVGHSWLAAVNPNLKFNPVHDLAPVAMICSIQYALLTSKNGKFKTLDELVTYAKAHPGEVALASAGVGTLTHLIPAWFGAEAGISMNHIPYAGTAPAMQSLLGNQVDLYLDPLATSVPYIKDGRVIPLATTGTTRSTALDDVPTFKEQGYDVSGTTWFGLVAPLGTPRPIIDKLNREVNALLAEAKIKDKLESMSFVIETTGVDEFGAYFKEQEQTWTKIVKDNGL